MYDDFFVVRKYGKWSAKFLLGTSTAIEKVEFCGIHLMVFTFEAKYTG